MKRLMLIGWTLLLTACVGIEISEGVTPPARYVSAVDWGLPAGVRPTEKDTVAPLYVALARTTQTIHDTCYLFCPSQDTLLRPVPAGDYHAIAFGGPLDTFYRVDNFVPFFRDPSAVGLADISLLLPTEEVQASNAAAPSDPEDPLTLCTEYLRSNAYFPIVRQALPVWLASDHRSLTGGETNTFHFSMKKMLQVLTVNIRIDFDERQCELQGLAIALNGVARRLNLLNGSVYQGETVISSSVQSEIGTILTKDLTLTRKSGLQHYYSCTVKTLGLFSPANEADKEGWGILEIAVKLKDKNVKSSKINLFRLLQDHPVLSRLGTDGEYRMAVSSATLNVPSYAYMSITPSSELEDETALDVWIEGDDHELPIRPEDE